MDFEYLTSEKGYRKLLFNFHLFVKDKSVGEKIYWKCEHFKKYECRARVVTLKEALYKVSFEHSHIARAE
jgi:hypothetical protein